MADTDLCSYVNWINENGGSFSKIQLVKDTDGNGRSVFATETIQTDDAFATIPFKLAISEPVARQAFPGLERFSCRIVMSLFVAHQKAIDSSFYAPYLNILPTDIKTPFFFDNNDMKYLENTNLALGVKERYQKLQQDFADLMADASVSDQVKASVTWDQFLWAHCAISSRSFPYKLIDPAYSNPSSEVLFPLVDSLNHRPNTKITWSRSGDAETGSLTFVAGQSFPAGEQVFNNYGPKSNEELLLGYGFCLENNEADHIALKPNITRDPKGPQKLNILQQCNISSGNTDPLTHYVHRHHIPAAYFKMMRVFVMNGVELAHYEHCSDPHALEFVGFRNELAMLSVTTGLIQSRVFAMKNDQLNRVNPTWWQKYALIYRDGQENLYNHTLDLIQARKLQVLKAMKKELNNNNCASTAPFINILNPSHYQLSLNGDEINSNNDTIFVPLEDVTISLKRLLANDKEFKDVIDQLFEDIEEEEDVVFMLALIHESTKRDSAWAPFIRATRMDRAEQRDEETMMDLQGLYESLFPAFSDAFPSVFDPAIYTPDNFLWAENVISNYTIDNPLVVVPL